MALFLPFTVLIKANTSRERTVPVREAAFLQVLLNNKSARFCLVKYAKGWLKTNSGVKYFHFKLTKHSPA